MKNKQLAAAGVLLGSLCVGSSALAAVAFGDDVKFTYDDASLFGSMTVIGNSFRFNPTTFFAQSQNGDGSVTTNATLVVTVEAITPGFELTAFTLEENGDYFGDLGGTTRALGELLVTSQTSLYDDQSLFDTGILTPILTNQDWDTSAAVNLANTAGWGSDTKVNLSLENVLNAEALFDAAPTNNAWIEKKLVTVEVFGTQAPAVPVPAAAWLFGSALAVLSLGRRKAV